MAVWFTADLHFRHKNIIRYCNRPFADRDAMNEALVAGIVARVAPEDDLWIVGDFSFVGGRKYCAETAALFERLPGRKHLVRGNHDIAATASLSWASQHDMAMVKTSEARFFLCHYPMLTWPSARHGVVHLFGHVHDIWRGARQMVNVGVDLWDFRPASPAEILARSTDLPAQPYFEMLS